MKIEVQDHVIGNPKHSSLRKLGYFGRDRCCRAHGAILQNIEESPCFIFCNSALLEGLQNGQLQAYWTIPSRLLEQLRLRFDPIAFCVQAGGEPSMIVVEMVIQGSYNAPLDDGRAAARIAVISLDINLYALGQLSKRRGCNLRSPFPFHA